MSTFLFDQIIFGPVSSRRLGISLGINLLPTDVKFCNFNCIYCECGWNDNIRTKNLPKKDEIVIQLESKLRELKNNASQIDVITFAGNGEPTLHHQFNEIIDVTIALRNKYFPDTKISVLSNATRINIKSTFDALLKVDNNILKLDSGNIETIKLLNQPNFDFNLNQLVENLQLFKGKLIIQTLFTRIKTPRSNIDNTSNSEIKLLIDILKKIKPELVMIYTISRNTPLSSLEKITFPELQDISSKIEKNGFKTSISG